MALQRACLLTNFTCTLFLLFASALSLEAGAVRPPPIVISGAGPAALIFAHRYLRLTAADKDKPSICIYERRSRPLRYVYSKNLCVAGDNAFGFGVSAKSKVVLRKTPGLLKAVEAISQPTAFATGIALSIVNRRELCAELMYELQKEFGSNNNNTNILQIHFETSVIDVDQEQQVVTVRNEKDNTTQRMPYGLLIAADGANSIIRSKLVESGDLQCERYYSDSTWKALQLPEQPNLDASTFERYPKPFFKPHRFLKRDNGALVPRFENRFVLLNFRAPPADGNYESVEGNNPFGSETPQDLKDAIAQILPNVTNFPDDSVLQEFLNQRPGRESYMKLDRHYVPHGNIVLIGDASVGMYSLFGQGASSAMTQADLLAQTIATVNDETEQTLALLQYSNSSVVEGHAIADLNLLQHVLRKRGPLKFWALFQMMGIGKTLVDSPEIPYSEILQKKKRAIGLSKLFWKRARIAAPTTTTTTINTTH